jgi:hypothetical protein
MAGMVPDQSGMKRGFFRSEIGILLRSYHSRCPDFTMSQKGSPEEPGNPSSAGQLAETKLLLFFPLAHAEEGIRNQVADRKGYASNRHDKCKLAADIPTAKNQSTHDEAAQQPPQETQLTRHPIKSGKNLFFGVWVHSDQNG